MTDDDLEDGALVKTGGDTEKYLTWAKWGLMGLGGLFVVKVALSVILNPLVLAGGAVAGGVGWWLLKARKRGEEAGEPQDGAASAEEETAAAKGRAAVAPSSTPPAPATSAPTPTEAFDEARIDAEAELDSYLGEGEADPDREDLNAFERRLRELEAIKARVRSEEDDD